MHGALLDWVAGICVIGATLGCIYMAAACVLVLRFAHRRRIDRAGAPPVTLLVPLYGAEPRLFERCAAFCRQDYGGAVQLICAVHDPTDPAIEVIKELQAAFPQQAISVEVDPRDHGPNRKVSNLINMMPLARHDIIVTADSDIEVGSHHLSTLIDELQAPGVGAVTCVYHGTAAAGLWSRLSALSINTHFLPHEVAAMTLHLAKPCFGATIAMRRETLRRIGGFAAFAGRAADDYMIGQAVRSAGLAVAVPAFSVGHVCFENDFSSLLRGQLRSARTIRSIDPLGHAGSILTHPFPLALLGAMFSGGGALLVSALVLAGVALGCRAMLAFCVERAFGLERQDYWLIPPEELILFAAYVLSFLGATVTWRGRCYRITPDGCLVDIESRKREHLR
jgi:ceramide glucosyltransferase